MPMPQAGPMPPQPAPSANPMPASAPPGPAPVDTAAILKDIEKAMHPTVEEWVKDMAKLEFEKLKAELEALAESLKDRGSKKEAVSLLELGEIDGDDLDFDAEPELPRRGSGKKTVAVDRKHRQGPEDEPEEFDDEDEDEPRRRTPRAGAERAPEEPSADFPLKPATASNGRADVVDLVTLAELAEWVGHTIANSGREYVETLLDLAVKTGRLSASVDEILRGLIRLLSDRDSSVRVSAKEMMLQLAQLDALLGVHDSTITRLLPLLLRDNQEEMPSVRL